MLNREKSNKETSAWCYAERKITKRGCVWSQCLQFGSWASMLLEWRRMEVVRHEVRFEKKQEPLQQRHLQTFRQVRTDKSMKKIKFSLSLSRINTGRKTKRQKWGRARWENFNVHKFKKLSTKKKQQQQIITGEKQRDIHHSKRYKQRNQSTK